jgi:hypothetical protein
MFFEVVGKRGCKRDAREESLREKGKIRRREGRVS